MILYEISNGNDCHTCALAVNRKDAKELQEKYSDDFGEATIGTISEIKNGKIEDDIWYYDYETNEAELAHYGYFWSMKERVVVSKDRTIKGANVLATDERFAKRKGQEMIAIAKARREGLL